MEQLPAAVPRGRGESPTSPRRLAAVDRARQALAMRKGGATYEQIAAGLGYKTRARAHEAVTTAVRRFVAEPAADVRHIEELRLDALLLAVWPQALSGDPAAVDRVLRIMQQRSRLLGLDALQVNDRHQAEHLQAGVVAKAVDDALWALGLAEEVRLRARLEIAARLRAAST